MYRHIMVSGSRTNQHKRFFLSNLSIPDTLIDLAANQSWEVGGNRRHQLICCIQGEVWVTQECDFHDYILDEGEAFLITLPGLVMVRALKASLIGYIKSLVQVPFKGGFRQTVFK